MTTHRSTASLGNAAAVREIGTVLAASLLLTLSAKLSVPFYPVPATLQTCAVIGLGFGLGPWRAMAAVLLYLGEGAAGLPVFSGTPEQGIGLAYISGPTGGYLLGYGFAALITGWAGTHKWAARPLPAVLAGLFAGAVIYVPGVLWLRSVIGFDKPILQYGLYPFVFGDAVKAILAALLFVAGCTALNTKGGR